MTAPAQPTLPEKLEAGPYSVRGDGGAHAYAYCGESGEALAAEIAKRWNAHAGLVAALEALVGTAENEGEVRAIEAEGMIDAADMQGYELGKCIKHARSLLAAVRGRP